MASYLPVFALMGTSGFFMPMDRLPSWVQAVQLVLPTYWSGHLTRWALVGDPSWEVGGAFSPVLAVGGPGGMDSPRLRRGLVHRATQLPQGDDR